MSDRRATVDRLRRERPRSRFLRASAVGVTALVTWAWWAGSFDVADLFSTRRRANLERFLGDVRPYPLHDKEWDWGVAWEWTWGMFTTGAQGAAYELPSGAEAVGVTLAMSVAAIVLAGIFGVLLAFPAANTFATPEPFLPDSDKSGPVGRGLWRALFVGTRGLLLFIRSIPEYLWAYLLIGMLGVSAWPAVLALALHNTGILGKLGAETIENLSPRALSALRGAGATRKQVATFAALPSALSRFLLYFFYRWETCVREATVLGMLGIVSLGYWIQDARAKQYYDEMVLLIAIGAVIVLASDLVSALARRYLRQGT